MISLAHWIFFFFFRFANGGLLFSTLFLFFIASVSLYCFLLLVKTRNKVPASFGDIGGILFGNSMRMTVLISITVSQVIILKWSSANLPLFSNYFCNCIDWFCLRLYGICGSEFASTDPIN